MDKRLFTKNQEVFFLNGTTILTGKISSMRLTDPENIKIARFGRVEIKNAFVDKPTALISQRILIETQLSILTAELKQNTQTLKEYWD